MLLPYLEGDDLFRNIDFTQPYGGTANNALNTTVATMRVNVLVCSSDPKATQVFDSSGNPKHFPLSYGLNVGEYLVYDPGTGAAGVGAFAPFTTVRHQLFQDGLSKTLALSEVKARTPRAQNISSMPATAPATADDAGSLAGSGTFGAESGHTEWVCGRALQTGFTTTFPPNTTVPFSTGGRNYDVDVGSFREYTPTQASDGSASPIRAVVTSRSNHAGGTVNSMMMDGSVRSFTNGIGSTTWRALGSRAGGEAVSVN